MTGLPYAALLAKLGGMFFVMGVGWWLRRARWLEAGSAATMSRITIGVAFPCLTLDQMLRTLDRTALQQSLPLIGLGFLLMVVSAALGFGLARGLAGEPPRLRTVAFLIAIPNWIFLPLPLAQSLAGEVGTRTVLLLNVPAQVILWTVGLGLLRGAWRGGHGLRSLLTNPGLVATAVAVALTIVFPASAQWHASASPMGMLVQGADLLGGLTVPLSLIVTGAQMAELRLAHAAPAALARVLVGRLVVAPLVCLLLVEYGGRLLGLDPQVRLVTALVAAMPVAVSCSMFVERYGGDRDLSAQSILLSTVGCIVSVPLVVALMGWLQ